MEQITTDANAQDREKEVADGKSRWRTRITNLIAAVLPFATSIPPLAAWGALMAIPLIGYLALLIVSGPAQFFEALLLLFFGGFLWELAVSIIGLTILVCSFAYMRIARKEGLIISGPYRWVRHPQYLGAILFTLTLTTRSHWIATHTFGMSWISPDLMIAIWFGTMFAYVVLALVEELHLAKKFPSEYEQYRVSVGFLFPYARSRNRGLEIFLSVLAPAIILFGFILGADLLLFPPIFPT
ncbi:MAG: hypothetical protein EAX95_10830 [Candidatus Thorarchaeota archaeon]|nr:hypothetical protein [Candidatus Thorarchaeota archaeon]